MNLRALAEDERGLPSLPSLAVKLHRAEAEPGPAARRLATIVAETLREAVAGAT
jgi:HD-like signal output (HDOD) protein